MDLLDNTTMPENSICLFVKMDKSPFSQKGADTIFQSPEFQG